MWWLRVQLREKRDEAATRDRFWDITQSKIGELTGTTAKEQTQAAEHADEASKMDAKFGGTGNADEGAPGPHLNVHKFDVLLQIVYVYIGSIGVTVSTWDGTC